jgi:hypothetical protein
VFSDLWELVVSDTLAVHKGGHTFPPLVPAIKILLISYTSMKKRGLSLLADLSSSSKVKHGDSDNTNLLVRLGLTRGGDTGGVFTLSLALVPVCS